MWDIKYIIKDLLETKNLQEFINHRFKDPTGSHIIIDTNIIDCVMVKGNKFYPSDDLFTIIQVYDTYHFNDILPTDIVLDIGANIGGFSILASKKALMVYAIEPITFRDLTKNIHLNTTNNIKAMDYALGNATTKVTWMKKKREVQCKSLSEIIHECGGHIDFLKLDCEGGEWSIKPQELHGIRRIEAEIHSYKGLPEHRSFLDILDKAGFNYNKEILSKEIMIVHANRSGLRPHSEP
ncbi:MAG TPA: FkbM family methyltransferase [Candidatus Methanoperedens sp.]